MIYRCFALAVLLGLAPAFGQESVSVAVAPRIVFPDGTSVDYYAYWGLPSPEKVRPVLKGYATPDAVLARGPSLPRLLAASSNGSRSGGSGAYLGDGFVLSCSHIVNRRNPRVTAYFPDGSVYQGKFIQWDAVYDISLIQLDEVPPGMVGIQLSTVNPKVGEPVYMAGYSTGRVASRPGQVRGFSRPANGRFFDFVEVSGASQPGDSGGPVFTSAGHIIGNLHSSDWAQHNTRTVAVILGRTERFLGEAILGRLDRWFSVVQKIINCPPGGT